MFCFFPFAVHYGSTLLIIFKFPGLQRAGCLRERVEKEEEIGNVYRAAVISWSVDHTDFLQPKCQISYGSSFSNVINCCFYLSYMTVTPIKFLDCYLHKTHNLMTSLWPLSKCDLFFHFIFYILWTKRVIEKIIGLIVN